MSFKYKRVAGDGSDVSVVSNDDTIEAVLYSLIAYNVSDNSAGFKLMINNEVVLVETIASGDSLRLTDKLNIPINCELKINADTDVNVTLTYLTQAIDPLAALAGTQQAVADAKQYADDASNSAAVATDNATIATDKAEIATAKAIIATDKAQIATDKAQTAVISEDAAYTSKINAQKSEINAKISENVAQASANNKGKWSNLTGALSIPASVTHSGRIWILNEDLDDVTTEEPGNSTKWTNSGTNKTYVNEQSILMAIILG